MAPQESSSPGKVYQFISDPGHKENLSGRVRAACLTCRRKKIKCSGSAPCSTCNEKGLLCEGLTVRKRPKRQSDSRQASSSTRANLQESTPAADDNSRPVSQAHSPRDDRSSRLPATNSPGRPTEALRKLNTESSNDSGYGTASHQPPGDFGVGKTSQVFDTAFSLTSASSDFNDSAPVSPTTYQDWGFTGMRHNSGQFQTDDIDSTVATAAPATLSATSLISAARLLEGQAQSLRQLASQHNVDDEEHMRRQTVALPLQPDHLTSSGGVNPYLQGSYDDMFPLLAVRIPGSRISPRAAEYDSLWNVPSQFPTTFTWPQSPTADQLDGPLAAPTAVDAACTAWRGSRSLPQELLAGGLAPAQRQRIARLAGGLTAPDATNDPGSHAVPALSPHIRFYSGSEFDGA